ncbi:MAG: acyltransferase family protein [Pseudomonadota bacterium]
MISGLPVLRNPTYRADIDGLRAIAVVAVMLFHARIDGFSGGFIGVDVFFVISGFLITQMLLQSAELPARRLLGHFYLRRARRILPALAVVLACTTVGAWVLLGPAALIEFGRYLLFAVASLINFAALRSGGYFNLDGQDVPLLHLWSLGVEEQFYLAYPLAFIALIRVPAPWRVRLLAALTLASFLLCTWCAWFHPRVNFFLPFTRAWELLAGGLVALAGTPADRSAARMGSEILAALALGTVLACVWLLESSLHHPGPVTLLPCIATAFLIASGRNQATAVSRLLSWRPLVAIGLISYSLYLWHLPLLAFATNYNIRPLDSMQCTLVMFVTGVSAAFTWKFVERPARNSAYLGDRAFLWAIAGAMGILAMSGAVLWRSDGLPRRFTPAVQALHAADHRFHRDGARCLTLTDAQIAGGELCSFGSSRADAAKIMLWGDSHAMALLPAFESLAIARGMRLFFAARNACRPLSGVVNGDAQTPADIRCASFNAAMAAAARRLNPETLVFAARWNYPSLEVVVRPGTDLAAGESPFARGFAETLRRAHADGRQVCVVLDVPRLDYYAPTALAMARRRSIDAGFIAPRRQTVRKLSAAEEREFIHNTRSRIVTVDPKVALCPAEVCRVVSDSGLPLFSDRDHLTIEGANLVASELDGCLADHVSASAR